MSKKVKELQTAIEPEVKEEVIEEPVMEVSENLFARKEVKEVTEEEVTAPLPGLMDIDASTIEEDPNDEGCGLQSRVLAGQRVHSVAIKEKEMKERMENNKVSKYWGYYSVNHPFKKGQYMDILYAKGERRKCPCDQIAISIEDVKAMCDDGYIFVNLDKNVNQGRTITKRNFPKYLTLVTNLINNGFLEP